MSVVKIHYHRPPAREDLFVQTLVEQTPEVIVTFMERTPLPRPVHAAGEVILESGSPAIWFTFPGVWYDIGLFHRADGDFTGTYTNILTPVHFLDESSWETTDLFLDHWIDAAGAAMILDEDEFAHAVEEGWLDAETESRARTEVDQIHRLALEGEWPPPAIREWTLERVLDQLRR
jgi:predicted RNA-binding protein associated with RNAse of E/G family